MNTGTAPAKEKTSFWRIAGGIQRHWLCSLVGHKHKGGDICTVWPHQEYCLRCNARYVTLDGDGCVRCMIFGHHHKCDIVGDSDGYRITTDWCQRCHASS